MAAATALHLPRLKKHIVEMMRDRGEENVDAMETAMAETLLTFKTSDTTLWIALTKDTFVRDLWKHLREASGSEMIEQYGTHNFVLVLTDKPSSQTMPLLMAKDADLLKLGGMFQILLARTLMINPTQHILVPKHTKLPETDVKGLMEQLQIKSKLSFPLMYRSDAQAVWLGLRPGDVVAIERIHRTSCQYTYYRCCVADPKSNKSK